MVQAYWHVGRLIVEHEQGGRRRAGVWRGGAGRFSRRLMAEFGRGFDVTNLRKMRQFLTGCSRFEDAVRLESGDKLKTKKERNAPRLVDAVRLISAPGNSPSTDDDELSPGVHYRTIVDAVLMISGRGPRAREWYMNEAANQHWSTRQLERQISVLYYERLLASRKKAPVARRPRPSWPRSSRSSSSATRTCSSSST